MNMASANGTRRSRAARMPAIMITSAATVKRIGIVLDNRPLSSIAMSRRKDSMGSKCPDGTVNASKTVFVNQPAFIFKMNGNNQIVKIGTHGMVARETEYLGRHAQFLEAPAKK